MKRFHIHRFEIEKFDFIVHDLDFVADGDRLKLSEIFDRVCNLSHELRVETSFFDKHEYLNRLLIRDRNLPQKYREIARNKIEESAVEFRYTIRNQMDQIVVRDLDVYRPIFSSQSPDVGDGASIVIDQVEVHPTHKKSYPIMARRGKRRSFFDEIQYMALDLAE